MMNAIIPTWLGYGPLVGRYIRFREPTVFLLTVTLGCLTRLVSDDGDPMLDLIAKLVQTFARTEQSSRHAAGESACNFLHFRLPYYYFRQFRMFRFSYYIMNSDLREQIGSLGIMTMFGGSLFCWNCLSRSFGSFLWKRLAMIFTPRKLLTVGNSGV